METLCRVQSSRHTLKEHFFFFWINDLKGSVLGRQPLFRESRNQKSLCIGCLLSIQHWARLFQQLSTRIWGGEVKDIFRILQMEKLRIGDSQCNVLKSTNPVSDARQKSTFLWLYPPLSPMLPVVGCVASSYQFERATYFILFRNKRECYLSCSHSLATLTKVSERSSSSQDSVYISVVISNLVCLRVSVVTS